MRIAFHKMINLVVAALVFAQTTMGHGSSHAHVGGGEDHTHANKVTDDDDHTSHHHASHHHDEQADDCTHKTVMRLERVSVQHTHITCLGFEIVIPDFDDSQSHETGSNLLKFVGLIDDCTIQLVGRSLDTNLLSPFADDNSIEEIVTSPSKESRFPQFLSEPLCDAARFERTGVLLI